MQAQVAEDDLSRITLTFDQPMETISATTAASFSLDLAVVITKATSISLGIAWC